MNTGKAALGILAGLATGAILGILLAPDKGSNTRRKIIGKGEGYVDDAKKKVKGFKNSLMENYENIKQDAKDIEEKAKSSYA
jgi:gas vesicle protein